MSNKYTAGPWTAATKMKHQQFIEIHHLDCQPGAASLVVAKVTLRDSWAEEQEANARLIAAAPLLHRALKNLLDASSLGGTDPQRRRDAKQDAIDALRAVDGA